MTAVAACMGKVLAPLGHQVVRRERSGQRVVGDRLLQHLLVLLEVVARLDQSQQIVDPGQHLRRIGFLGYEVVRAQVAGALLGALVLVARDDDDRHRLDTSVRGAPDPFQQAEAVELGHVDVGDDHDDRRIGLDGLPAGLAVGHLAHFERGAEDPVESGADELGVVDYQDPLFRDVALRHQAAMSTTMRPRTWALMNASNAEGSCSKGIVRTISFSAGGRISVASRRQTSSRSSCEGASVELMPSRDTPRKMNGITVVFRLALAARPMEAITPFTFMVLAIQARTSPPRLSTAPAHIALSKGLIFVRSISVLSLTSFAPSFFSHSVSADFPVNATT